MAKRGSLIDFQAPRLEIPTPDYDMLTQNNMSKFLESAEAPLMELGIRPNSSFLNGWSENGIRGVGGALGSKFGKLGEYLTSDYRNMAAVLQGIGSFGSMLNSRKELGLARENLAFKKEAYNTNMNNQIKSYNTALEDRYRGRTSEYVGKENDIRDLLQKNQLTRSSK